MTDNLTFASLGLSQAALDSLKRARFEVPTPIQQRAIPPALAGRDVVGCAATGTGKTAAFVLPLVERLEGKRGIRALILAPTRELAEQIFEQLELFGRQRKVYGAVVIGGVGMGPQVNALRQQPQVVIATPGRLIDHLSQGTVHLNEIEALVLDEADRMLDMGFKPQLERILAKLPKKRQTMLFSATMAGEVAAFAQKYLNQPERVEVARSGTVAERAEQRVYLVPQLEKTALLIALLGEDEASTLVFTRTKHRADRLCKSLMRAGYDAARIHADRSQGQRRTALEGFRNGDYRILVATDIAARGIDVEEIGLVVNFDLPHVPEDYVHRVGRTARASKSGRAASFCSPEERPLLRDIEKLIRLPVPVAEVPRESQAFQDELERHAKAQRDPGPQQPKQGHSGRPAGQPPGRHARTHPKKKAAESGVIEVPQPVRPRAPKAHPDERRAAGAKPAGQRRSVGSWRPKRRR